MSAIQAYRALFRATRLAFQGDARLLAASRKEIRTKFDENRTDSSVSQGGETAQDKVNYALEVARVLRENVVQGEQRDGQSAYTLRIHDDTERGDNESIKTPLKGRTSRLEKCS